MRLVIAAPANGAILKDALKVHLQNDPRVSSLIDLSSPEGTYPQLSFAGCTASMWISFATRFWFSLIYAANTSCSFTPCRLG